MMTSLGIHLQDFENWYGSYQFSFEMSTQKLKRYITFTVLIEKAFLFLCRCHTMKPCSV